MRLQIVLPLEVEALVQRQIANGNYQTAIKVIKADVKLQKTARNRTPTQSTQRKRKQRLF